MSIAASIAIKLLERSNDPELREIAKWIKDAEGRVVDLVLDALGQSLKTTGQVDSAKDQLSRIRDTAGNAPSDPLDPWTTRAPWLVEQARMVRTIAALAAWRRAICLQGFFHDASCTSLWHFPTDKPIVVKIVQEFNGQPEVTAIDREVKIYLLPPSNPVELEATNVRIGANYTEWLLNAKLDTFPRVTILTEDRVTITHEVQVARTNRRGAVTSTSETKLTETPISQRELAFDEMLASLPGAIEARDRELQEVRSKLK